MDGFFTNNDKLVLTNSSVNISYKWRTMKKNNWFSRTCTLLLVGGIFASGWALYAPQRTRAVFNINKTWKFIKQDVSGAQAVGFNDAAWSPVNLPHSFEQPYWRTDLAKAPFIGWYRKHVSIDSALILDKKRIFIEFEAAFLVSYVYVNGTLVGTHKGGYTGFSYDITPNLHAGDNVIAVRLDASWNAQIAPRAGEHIFAGGIYRDVYLVVADPLHVTWYGTFVFTPRVTTSSASVTVKTEVRNDTQSPKSCKLKTTIYDSSHTTVASIEATQSIASGVTDTFVQTNLTVSNPHLWSPSTPYLYTVYTEVYDGETKVDDFVSPLGIRSIRWDKDNGFFMNDQHLWLQGCNVHQDHAGWGDGTTNSGSFRDVKMIKDCGMNFIRGSHYPHDPAFYDACDALGVTLWSEMCFWGIGGFGGEPSTQWNPSAYPTNQVDQLPFEQNVIEQLKEMIRIYRNHPSVIIWSMDNEVEFSASTVTEKAKALLRKEVAVSHIEDSTRLAGIGGTWSDWQNLGDVNGYNGGETTVLNPGVPNMMSEYGSCGGDWIDSGDRPGSYDGCYNGAYGVLQSQNDRPTQFPWRAGVSIWCGFNHGSNCGKLGKTGMIDHARLPLRRYYFYRNIYTGIAPPVWPVAGTAAKLKLTTDNDTITDDGRSDCQLIVQVQDASGKWISNTPDITFTDKSGLGVFPTGTAITFTGGASEKGVLEGMAAIEYRSYNAGTVTIEATSQGLTPSSVTIIVKHVADPTVTTGVRHSILSSAPVQPHPASIMQFTGNRIRLPGIMRGHKVCVSVYDLQGRLIVSRVIDAKNSLYMLEDVKAESVAITKLRVVK
jgi:beta-galactosidase